MSHLWGVAIPGLAMHNSEIPAIPGLLALQNPEVGDGVNLDSKYSLNDVAEIHLKAIKAILSDNSTNRDNFWIIGMSMGGMVNSILASELRSKLPANIKFGFFVTTANLSSNQAVPEINTYRDK
ncbi:MAG: hypothetical protein ACXVCP_18835 [Bdellovibrio sp.]